MIAQVAASGVYGREIVGDADWEESPQPALAPWGIVARKILPHKLARLRAAFWSSTWKLDLGVWMSPSGHLDADGRPILMVGGGDGLARNLAAQRWASALHVAQIAQHIERKA